jgi:hypothetical protein
MDQTWYAMMQVSKFDAIKRHFEKLEEIGPNGYFRAFEEHLDRVSENSCAGSF